MTTYDDRPWLQQYDPHVPHSLEPYPNKVMTDYLQETVQSTPNRAALVTTNKVPLLGRVDSTITFGELNDMSDA